MAEESATPLRHREGCATPTVSQATCWPASPRLRLQQQTLSSPTGAMLIARSTISIGRWKKIFVAGDFSCVSLDGLGFQNRDVGKVSIIVVVIQPITDDE